MPYIDDNRDAVDGFISEIQEILCDTPRDKRKGDVNYVLSRIALGAFMPEGYHDISDAVNALKDAAVEIERRLMGPREDEAIEANGDLIEYLHILGGRFYRGPGKGQE